MGKILCAAVDGGFVALSPCQGRRWRETQRGAMRAGHTSVSVVDRYRHLFPAELERTTARPESMFAPVVEIPTGAVVELGP